MGHESEPVAVLHFSHKATAAPRNHCFNLSNSDGIQNPSVKRAAPVDRIVGVTISGRQLGAVRIIYFDEATQRTGSKSLFLDVLLATQTGHRYRLPPSNS